MTRLDAVNYIAHGIAKKPGLSEERRVRGTGRHREPGEEGGHGGARLLRQSQRQGRRGADRRAGRARARDRAHHPDPVPPLEEQSLFVGVPVSARPQSPRNAFPHRPGRGARGPQERHHLRARPGRAARRHPLPRRFRGTPEGRADRARGQQARDPVHRRDPHRDRRRRHQRRLARRVEHSQAGVGGELRCIGSTTYKEFRNYFEKDRALVRRFQKIDVPEPTEDEAVKILEGLRPSLRGPPPGALHRRRARRRGQAVDPLHARPQAAGQGDRRDRRGRCRADAAPGPSAQEDHQGARHRGDRRQDDPRADQDRQRRDP